MSAQPAQSTEPVETAPAPFAHLRIHTDYSIRDGLVTIAPLITRLRDIQMPAVAITDQANLFALIKFYSAAVKAGIKPLCGCDVLVQGEDANEQTRLVLLVRNRQGYLSLTKLISNLYLEHEGHGEPALDKAALTGKCDGLIALSGAQFSDVGRALLDGDMSRARQLLDKWRGLFPDGYYLELQRVGKESEEAYIAAAITLAGEADCPVVATNDVRFVEAEDFEAHEVRVCINDSRTLSDPRRQRHYTEQQYLRTGDEMAELFADIPEALANAWEIARRCNLELTLGKPSLPNYPVPESHTLEDYLSELATKGLAQRLASRPDTDKLGDAATDVASDTITDATTDAMTDSAVDTINSTETDAAVSTTNNISQEQYTSRLEWELGIINQMGFAGYFLIVMEFIQWAKDNYIPVGPGRGSGAGSLVAYALGITDLDPLKYDLLFERFLNPERVSMPDFDVDFCMVGRDRVIDHVAELYGTESVSQIITFGTMAAKAVVRDVARAQGKPFGVGDKLSKLIPNSVGMTLQLAMEEEPALAEHVAADAEAQEVMDMAYKLEGIVRQVGTHAGGVVIAPTQLTDFTPLYCDESGGAMLTQFDKDDVETAGLVKFDFLGLRTLTVIDWAVKMINEQEPVDKPLNINELPLNDPDVYKMLQRGETTAVFQLESPGMKDLIKRILPNCFEDIIALVALFRPGPLQSGMVDDFIERKHGRVRVQYPHPELAAVLANTYGVILYQEQVMQIAQVLANYTLGGADILRKAMGKKIPAEMAKQRSTFMQGARDKGIDEKQASNIFDLMEKFAGYGFNKSHSAAYALVAYQTAWLKTHYPAYYMAAVLTAEMQNTDKIVTLIEECRSMKLRLLPPDVNMGEYNFTVNEAGEIVYGLGAIKGLGEGPVKEILAGRKETPFKSLLDLCQRGDSQILNKRALEALIKAGALDALVQETPAATRNNKDIARAGLWASLPDAVKAAEQRSRNQASGVDDMFGGIAPVESPASADDDPTTSHQLRPWSEKHRLLMEKEALGLYLSGHPVDEYLPELSRLVKHSLAEARPLAQPQTLAGLVHGLRIRKNKSGSLMAILTLDDRTARLEITLFSKEFEQFRDILQKDEILVVECVVSTDDYTGGMKGRLKSVMTLDQARQKHARCLELRLTAETLEDNFCEHLANILAPYRRKQSATAPPGIANKSGSNAPPSSGTPPNNGASPNNGAFSGNGAPSSNGTPLGNRAPPGGGSLSGSGAMPTTAASQTDSNNKGCRVEVHYQRGDVGGCIMFGQEWSVAPNDDLIQHLKSEYGRDKVGLRYTD